MSDSANNDHPPMAVLDQARLTNGRKSQQRSRIIIAVLLLFIAVLVAMLLRPAKLDVYKTFDELNFADPVLAQCVRDTAAAHGWSDVGKFVSLRCNNPSGQAIRSIGGIEHLVALTNVNLAFNELTDVALLGELPRLRIVELSHNRLSTIPQFRSGVTIARLEANYNQLESLEWLTEENFAVLQSLSVAHNHIGDLAELEYVPSLIELNVRNNRLTSLGAVQSLEQLDVLDAGSNDLRNIADARLPNTLRRLFLDRNELESALGLGRLERLEVLDLSSNAIDDLSPLARLQRLQRLDLSNTRINELDAILSLGDLEVLRLQGDVDLKCADIARAIAEFGKAAVRYDLRCDTGSSMK